MRPDFLIARFGELWLKGSNRHQFTAQLRKNLVAGLRAAGVRGGELKLEQARAVYTPPSPDAVPTALAVFRDTPGLANVSACVRAPKDLEALCAIAEELVRHTWTGPPSTFVCRARRVDKRFPHTAPTIERTVGDRVGLVVPDWKVDVRDAARTVMVEVLNDLASVSVESFDGSGGLPVGSAGRVALLLSGGLDSPVAGYLAQKRGCELVAVYFHSPPFIAEASREKVETLARRLSLRQNGLTLHVVRFTEIQEAIRVSCDPKLTVILYRRFMYRIAAAIARDERCLALCTGENLGQVASQTLENLEVVDRLTARLTLRPLITMDKSEIFAWARSIGTYDTSNLPAEDCCTLFVPRHPAVRAPLQVIEDNEALMDVEGLIAAARSRTEIVRL